MSETSFPVVEKPLSEDQWKSAYREVSGGSTWATVAVSSAGKLFRYTSALKYKENIRPWALSAAAVLQASPIKYVDKASGETRVGILADSQQQNLPELVQYGEDGEVEGFQYFLLPVAQQVVLRNHDKRIEALEVENRELRAAVQALLDKAGLGWPSTNGEV